MFWKVRPNLFKVMAASLIIIIFVGVEHQSSLNTSQKKSSKERPYEQILQEVRAKIRHELSNYNKTDLGDIAELFLNSKGTPIRTIIVSTWRSGSSFFGAVLNSIPGTYFLFEPLFGDTSKQISGPPFADVHLEQLKNLIQCKYYALDDYFSGTTDKQRSMRAIRNTRLWNYCKDKKELCSDRSFLTEFCKLHPALVMKLVRFRLLLIPPLLSNPDLKVKVIYLVRDPRAVIESRIPLHFCQVSRDCHEASHLCGDMVSDYEAAAHIMKEYPDRFMVIRFEELGLDPYATTHRVLEFLGLGSFKAPVDEFLKTLKTKVYINNPYDIHRKTRDIPFKWKNISSFERVDEIQRTCQKAMRLWGYKMATNETHMRSKNFNPLDEYVINQNATI